MKLLERLVRAAQRANASDLHIQGGRAAVLRIAGQLTPHGNTITGDDVESCLREALRADEWSSFCARGSLDFSRVFAGVRCRINAMRSMRGIGLALRLLGRRLPTLREINLHPSLADLARQKHGLVLVSGPTGSGKSTTVAALLREMQRGPARHIITLEQPIEFILDFENSLVRQREVGRDTPSFQQGLIDALREDPDVIVVGEIRDPETMRLALDAAETGHLVLTTIHSSNVGEALSRITSAFAAEVQPLVCAQLADCLEAVVCQSLRYRPELDLRIPECEILRGTTPARSLIRKGDFFRIESVLQTGAADGQWSRARYRAWLDAKNDFSRPPSTESTSVREIPQAASHAALEDDLPPVRADEAERKPTSSLEIPRETLEHPSSEAASDDVIVIDTPTGTLEDIIGELDGEA